VPRPLDGDARVDCAQGLDGTDAGLALAQDAVGEGGVGHRFAIALQSCLLCLQWREVTIIRISSPARL
jgi:hypothetical protein